MTIAIDPLNDTKGQLVRAELVVRRNVNPRRQPTDKVAAQIAEDDRLAGRRDGSQAGVLNDRRAVEHIRDTSHQRRLEEELLIPVTELPHLVQRRRRNHVGPHRAVSLSKTVLQVDQVSRAEEGIQRRVARRAGRRTAVAGRSHNPVGLAGAVAGRQVRTSLDAKFPAHRPGNKVLKIDDVILTQLRRPKGHDAVLVRIQLDRTDRRVQLSQTASLSRDRTARRRVGGQPGKDDRIAIRRVQHRDQIGPEHRAEGPNIDRDDIRKVRRDSRATSRLKGAILLRRGGRKPANLTTEHLTEHLSIRRVAALLPGSLDHWSDLSAELVRRRKQLRSPGRALGLIRPMLDIGLDPIGLFPLLSGQIATLSGSRIKQVTQRADGIVATVMG